MTTKKPEYDRFAKQLWVKVYQEELTRSYDNEEAKDTADLAIADYMNSIHGVTSVVKENFTTEKDYEDGWNEWNDCTKCTYTKNIIKERDNYYNELQKLRQENADLEAENNQIRIKLSDTLYDLVETQVEDEAAVIEQAMSNVAMKAEIEDQWLNVLTLDEYTTAFMEASTFDEAGKKTNRIIFQNIKPLIDENVRLKEENKRLKEQNENLDVAYMAGVIDAGKKQSVDSSNMIEVAFTLDEENDVEFDAGNSSTVNLCTKLNRMYIDQTRIKRILLEMKSQDE